MQEVTRRAILTSSLLSSTLMQRAASAFPGTRMTISLSAGSIGVKADQLQAIQYAHDFGYDAVEADTGYLKTLSPDGLKKITDDLKAKKLVWGTSGMPTEFRKTDEEFEASLKELPERASVLKKVGGTRMSTWISPTSDTMTYRQNFDQHARRLGAIGKILADHGIRFGLEYVGPKLSWSGRRFPFVHTMRETKELIAATGQSNIGFVLDSWHWYTAGENTTDLETLKPSDIVSVDLNDAPAGLTVDLQVDSQRELPCATGVIDAAGFLRTLNKLGCDAPVRCEPFNAVLRKMPPEQALQTTIEAMKKAFGMIRS